MKYIKRFIFDLLYGLPAFSNLKWEIREDIREKTGYYRMKKIPLQNMMKWADILAHRRMIINKKEANKLFRAICHYNQVLEETGIL